MYYFNGNNFFPLYFCNCKKALWKWFRFPVQSSFFSSTFSTLNFNKKRFNFHCLMITDFELQNWSYFNNVLWLAEKLKPLFTQTIRYKKVFRSWRCVFEFCLVSYTQQIHLRAYRTPIDYQNVRIMNDNGFWTCDKRVTAGTNAGVIESSGLFLPAKSGRK